MKFLWTTLYVKNMEESLRFYQDIVGLTLEKRFGHGPNAEMCFLGDGETKIELIYQKDCQEIDPGKTISLGFSVASLDEKLDFVKEKGVPVHSGPFQPAPNVRFFFVLDPNGLKIQFVEGE